MTIFNLSRRKDRHTDTNNVDNGYGNTNNVSIRSDVESNFDSEYLMAPTQPQRQLLPPEISHESSMNVTTQILSEGGNSTCEGMYVVEEAKLLSQSRLLATCILILGIAASGAFVGLGISTLRDAENTIFDHFADDLYHKISASLADYAFAASMIHARCRSRNFTRQDFRDVYEYVIGDNLSVQAIDFKPRVLREERAAYENEAREFYAMYYPHVNYTGFVGFNFNNSTKFESRIEADVYYPVQYHEPIPGNEKAAGLDFYASGSRRRAIDECLRTGKPSISDRLTLVQEKVEKAFGVVLLHPGVNVSSQRDVWPHDLASIVIRIPDLLKRSTMFQNVATDVYLFDILQDSKTSATYLGGLRVKPYNTTDATEQFTMLPETSIMELPKNTWLFDIPASNKIWCLAIVPNDDTFNPATVFVILGGITIFVASFFLAFTVHTKTHRIIQYNNIKRDAELERAALILDNARKSAKSERELNDFIAHEVRNPVAAAMAACSFVERTTNKSRSALDDESWDVVRGDVNVISNALYFINDLLRTMLDMHRATSQQLVLTLSSVHVLHDVLEPVQSILYSRGNVVKLHVECDTGLYASADKLRLKQVMLNLGRNSTKFVETGFIRFTAKKVLEDDSIIEFAVEDSGPGIPIEKRQNMFTKYQDSLDGLAQGTGIGLYLCKKLISLMGGKLSLDESYDSGIPGCPGTRITFCLKASTAATNEADEIDNDEGIVTSLLANENEAKQALPEGLSVLFVDDDAILRKLFVRVIQGIAPTWIVRQASNGETALQLTDTETFDLIFMDMYMASVEKQLLGTETVAALRAKGVTGCICGLSANDKESEFLEVGANAFLFKPIPCAEKLLTRELLRILNSKG